MLDSFQAYKLLPDPALPNHMSGGHVVGYAVDPSSHRTSLVEGREATPELEMDFLPQVAPGIGIELIGSGEAVERGSIEFGGLFVEKVLPQRILAQQILAQRITRYESRGLHI